MRKILFVLLLLSAFTSVTTRPRKKRQLGASIARSIVGSIVRQGLNDLVAKLTSVDFYTARHTHIPDEPISLDKILRYDLWQGDISGVNRGSWRGKTIPFVISSRYENNARIKLAAAINEIHDNTCLRFTARNNERDYLFIRPISGCYSMVGRQGGSQDVSLSPGCFQHGTIIHELLHAAGFSHEQARHDRDRYIEVKWQNIQSGYSSQFTKSNSVQKSYKNTPYDYKSVMHYGTHYFSKNGRPTLVARQRGARIGQRTALSHWDAVRVNNLYNCGKKIGPDTPSEPPLDLWNERGTAGLDVPRPPEPTRAPSRPKTRQKKVPTAQDLRNAQKGLNWIRFGLGFLG